LGLTKLRGFLKNHRRIAIDTSIFIYHLEAKPAYFDMADEVFAWLERAPHSAVTSTLTMTELLVQPYRGRNLPMVNQCYGLLATFPNLEWIAPDLAIADAAAQIRADHRLRTPNALQIATGIRSGATAFLTNDLDLSRVTRIEVGILDRLR
jgi:predicted nucleic acid-binding protein